jgi:Mrp family chromosome partitioning ATPase
LIYVGLGAFLGLVLGLCLVIGIEYFNPRFRSPQEAEETMGLPVLGMLPKERGAKSSALLPAFGEGSLTWLAYSELRGSIILSQEDESSKSILAISAMPFEAGPGIAANLAVSIAYTGRKTLLVDCDLAGRAVSQLMDAGDKPGLSDALERGDEAWDEITGTEFENLSLLPAGKPSRISAELLSLPLFEEIIRGLEAQYKKVVIYAPPLAISIDGPVVASKARVTYFVLDVDKTSRKVALEAMSGFDRVNVKPAGLVLANVKVKGKERARLSTKAAPAKKKEKRETAAAATVAAEGAVPAEKAKKKRRQRPAKKKEKAKGKAAAAPEPKPYFTPTKTAAAKEAPKKAVEKPAEKKPEPAIPKKPAEELNQMKEIVADDFSRMGETGAPIPKEWLRALNSNKPDVRESATKGITAYYNAFLRRYNISDESIGLITESIIRMMRREGEFAHMNEKEAQQYLQEMLVDAGAKFSGSPSSGPSGTGEQKAKPNITTNEPKAEKESSRKEREQLEREIKEDMKAGEEKGGKTSQLLETEPQPEKENGIDWE